MKQRDAHRRLLTLLSLVLCATVALLAGCGALLPQQKASQSTDRMAEAFDEIVPGMTRADDLPGLGFDTAAADVLSARAIAQRFAREAGVRDCIHDALYCTGFVFHAAGTSGLFQRVSHSARQPADVVLLVMNGRVIHKVFSASPLPDQGDARIASAAF
jgi:hypothetical protein